MKRIPEFSAALQKIQEVDEDAFTKKMYKKYDSSMSNSDIEGAAPSLVNKNTLEAYIMKEAPALLLLNPK